MVQRGMVRVGRKITGKVGNTAQVIYYIYYLSDNFQQLSEDYEYRINAHVTHQEYADTLNMFRFG